MTRIRLIPFSESRSCSQQPSTAVGSSNHVTIFSWR